MGIPVAVNDVVRIILRGNMNNGDDMLNVFHYEFYEANPADPVYDTLENLAYGFWQNIKAYLRQVTHTSFSFHTIDALKLDADFNQVNGETWLIPPAEQAGVQSGDALPRFNTYTFKYVRPSLAFRHGWKRFAGVPELYQAGGTPTPTALGELALLAGALAADISATPADGSPTVNPGDARPIIYQAHLNGDPVSPVVIGYPSAVVFNNIGTQNTRK